MAVLEQVMYESVKLYSVSVSLSPVLYKLTNVIYYYSFYPSLTPQWSDSIPVYMCMVRIWREPVSVLYPPNLSPVQLMAVICTAIPIYRYGC